MAIVQKLIDIFCLRPLSSLTLVIVLAAVPSYAENYQNLLRYGDDSFALGRITEAQEHFENALDVAEGDDKRIQVLGRLLVVADKRGDAKSISSLSIEILSFDPENNWAAFMKAKAVAMQRGEGHLFTRAFIRLFQEELIIKGHLDGRADGIWGSGTAAAAPLLCSSVETAANTNQFSPLLNVLGVCADNQQVAAALPMHSDTHRDERVDSVHRELIRLGYLPENTTNQPDIAFTEAINNFRTDAGMEASSTIDDLLLGELGIEPDFRLPKIVMQKGSDASCIEGDKAIAGYCVDKNGEYSGTFDLWSLSQKKLIRTFNYVAYDFAIHPQGKFIAIEQDTRLVVYSLPELEIVHSIPTESRRTALRFSRDGAFLLAVQYGMQDALIGWKTASFKEEIHIDIKQNVGWLGQFGFTAGDFFLSPDGKVVALLTNDLPKELEAFKHKIGACYLTFYSLPDGKVVHKPTVVSDEPASCGGYTISGFLPVAGRSLIQINEKEVLDLSTGTTDTLAAYAHDYPSLLQIAPPAQADDTGTGTPAYTTSPSINTTSIPPWLIDNAAPTLSQESIFELHIPMEGLEEYELPLSLTENSGGLEGLPAILVVSKRGSSTFNAAITLKPADFEWLGVDVDNPDSNEIWAEIIDNGSWKVPLIDPTSQFLSAQLNFGSGARAHWGKYLFVWNIRTNELLLKEPVGMQFEETSVSFNYDGSRLAYTNVRDGVVVLNTVSWTKEYSTYSYGRHEFIYSDANHYVVHFLPHGTHMFIMNTHGIGKVIDIERNRAITTSYLLSNGNWLTITPEGFFDSKEDARELTMVDQGIVSDIDQYFDLLYRPDLVMEAIKGDPDNILKKARQKLFDSGIVSAGPPPRINFNNSSLLTGQRNLTRKVSGKNSVFNVEVHDQGGGIGRIEWRVNGVTVALGNNSKRTIKRTSSVQNTKAHLNLKRTFSLSPGKNIIEAVAYNAKNSVASRPATTTVQVESTVTPTKPRLFVVAVGVNAYWDSALRLANAVTDAKALGEHLKQAGQEIYSDVVTHYMLDEQVTKQGLESMFNALADTIKSTDTLVLFLAGHGVTTEGRYYFLPQDFHYQNMESIAEHGISQTLWQQWLAGLPAQKSLFLLDTCESGSMTDLQFGSRGIEQVAALERLMRATGRTTIAASQKDAPALEGYKGHGIFTYVLLDALATADMNDNSLIEISELVGRVDQHLPELSYQVFGYRQVPRMMMQGNDFAIAQTHATESAMDTAATAIQGDKPTHVVIRETILRSQPGDSGRIISTLRAGSLVHAAFAERGTSWRRINYKGTTGYVSGETLLEVH